MPAIKRKYRLLAGVHQTREGDKKITHRATKGRRGTIIESEIDLVKKFGREKFERLTVSRYEDEAEDAGPAETSSSPPEIEDTSGLDLSGMTISELRKLADEEEIDLGTATKKDEIINTINEALSAQ